MCRAEIVGPHAVDRQSDREYWEWWLRQKQEKRELGYRVRGELRKKIEQRIDEVEKESYIVQKKLESFAKLRELLKSMDVDEDMSDWYLRQETRRKLEAAKNMKAALPRGLVSDLTRLRDQLNTVVKTLDGEEED